MAVTVSAVVVEELAHIMGEWLNGFEPTSAEFKSDSSAEWYSIPTLKGR
jgi:hypothetical protein